MGSYFELLKNNNGNGDGVKPDEIDGMIKTLHANGYFVTREAQRKDYEFDAKRLFHLDDLDSIRLGLVADSHIGSKFQQITYLHDFYDKCRDRGVNAVLHAGDISDGCNMYRGQEYELFLHGADAQSDYIVNNYPHGKDFDTFFIGGNHDESFHKGTGHDICKSVADRRKDMHNLGFYGAYLMFEKTRFYVMHLDGGVPYARSYRPQKIIEQFSPDKKPHVLLCGHLHVTDYLNSYRNVMSFLLPCFQSQTPYLRRKGLYPELGGVILDILFNPSLPEAGIVSVKHEWISYFEPLEEDY